MATDPAVELARGYTQCTRCNGRGFDSLDHTCSECEGSGASAEWLDRLRTALDAARVEERAACVDLCRARVDSLTEECLRLKWDDDRRAELEARAEGAYDCAGAIRGRRG